MTRLTHRFFRRAPRSTDSSTMGRRQEELPEARLEHIETLERLGRLAVRYSRAPGRVYFVRLDAFLAPGGGTLVASDDDYLDFAA